MNNNKQQTPPNKQNKPNRQKTQNTKKKNTTKSNAKNSKANKQTKPVRNQKSKTQKNRSQSNRKRTRKNIKAGNLKLSFIGGLNEVGKNITLYEYEDEMILIDCGLAFPEQDMLGVDIVIPDFTHIEKNADKIKGIFITHGHEDHIGALPYLLKNVNLPIYSTPLTIGLIEGKLKEHHLLDKAKLFEVHPGDTVELGAFSVEMIHVNHSIPDALAFAITTPAGTVVQTGDFKIDTTPIDGEMIDISRFAQIGKEGVLCLLSDSTNAERPGYTESERKVGESFNLLFRKAGNRRIIVATFSSNIHRVQQIIDEAATLKRKVVLLGRSLEHAVEVGAELGYLKVPEGIIISVDRMKDYTPEQIVIITTGSQGEPMSALARMAFSSHRKVNIGANDYVIISATPIPGNEKMVSKVVNELLKHSAEVVYEKMYDVHVSGHACQEELKLMIGVCKPKYFIPVHGEQKHLRKHAELAQSLGVDNKNIILAENGNVVEMNDKEIKISGNVPAGRVFVDGIGVGDVGNVVLRDRKKLAEDGIIIVVSSIDSVSYDVLTGPDIISRGFVYVRESEELMEEAKSIALDTILKCIEKGDTEWNIIKNHVRDDMSDFIYNKTKRNPMIIPIIMEV